MVINQVTIEELSKHEKFVFVPTDNHNSDPIWTEIDGKIQPINISTAVNLYNSALVYSGYNDSCLNPICEFFYENTGAYFKHADGKQKSMNGFIADYNLMLMIINNTTSSECESCRISY